MSYSFEPLTIPVAESEEVPRIDPPSAGGGAPELPELHPPVKAPAPAAPPTPAEVEQARVEQIAAEAQRRGFEEGRRAEQVRAKTAIEAVHALVVRLESADVQREEEARDRIATLATAIATHLVEREVRTAPELMSDLVRRALAEFPVNDPLSVHLHPSDLAMLSSGLADEAGREQLTSGQSVRWIPDPAVRSGGCLVEGAERVVDARLSRAVERIYRALANA